MRAKLPTNNMGHIVLGTLDTYKEFAWIWPHIRCKLMDSLKPFRTKLITLMKEGLDLHNNLHTSNLLKDFGVSKLDIQFLMTCAMIFTQPVIMDKRLRGNQPSTIDELERIEMLERYCRFPDAHRTLLSFCTFTALSRSGAGFGKSRVQFAVFRDDYTDP